MTEKELRQKVVSVMEGWNGCKESDGSHKKIIDIYNGCKPLARSYAVKYTDAWCATTVSAAGISAGLSDIILRECSCNKMIELYKKAGRWEENDAYVPDAGDIIFYDWQDNGVGDNVGTSEHVGMVVSVSNGKIRVIEGNKSNAVGYRTLDVNGKYIRGFGLPDYASKATKSTTTTTSTTKKSVEEVAKEVLNGKWGNGNDRKAKLLAAGYNYNEVQSAVNALASGKTTSSTKKSIEIIAKEVLNGKWGNGTTRKQKLEAAGYNYNEVQKKVNELCKK